MWIKKGPPVSSGSPFLIHIFLCGPYRKSRVGAAIDRSGYLGHLSS